MKLANSREQIKEICHILPVILLASEEAQIRINPRGGRIIVAGGQMHVTANSLFLPAHYQAQLGVNFIAHQTVDHMHPRFFQFSRPENVVRFVKARAQFHHGRHLLAIAHSLH